MLLAPSRTKYRRQHRGRMKGAAHRGNTLAFGEFGLQALEPCWLEARQIEAARIALTRFMKRGGKVWIRVFPDKPITAKPAETRMGSGKGAVDHWVVVVKPGRIIFEIGGVSEEVAKEAIRLASHKLPVSTRFITRGEAESVEA
ncbi:MAG: 50S ribosomal protein L16 [Ktedonobacteraceae bacterium]|jgi:large subunit ribosomal protein L16